MFIATHWPEIERFRPERGWPFSEFDKLVHMGLYAGWLAAWWWVLMGARGRVTRAALAWLVAGGAAYAVFDELTQGLVDRTPSLADAAADAAGTCIAVAVLWIRQGRARPKTSR